MLSAPDVMGLLDGHPPTRRQGRRRRSAPHPTRQRAHRRGCRSGPAPTPCCCSRSCAPSPSDGCGSRARAPRRAGCSDSTRSSRWPQPFTPETGRRGRPASTAEDDPPPRRTTSRSADNPVLYSRIGACTQEFGTLGDVAGVRDQRRAGRAWTAPAARLFTKPAGVVADVHEAARPGRRTAGEFGRFHSRVRGAPEVLGQFPVGCLAEEIDTPGRRADPCADHGGGQPRRSPRLARGRLDAALADARRHDLRSTTGSTRPPGTPT